MDFYDYYFTDSHTCDEIGYEIDLNDLTGEKIQGLFEVAKSQLMTKTDPGRIKRARNDIKTHRRNIRIQKDAEGNEIIEFDFRANPSREFRNHWGYVIHDGNDIKQVFCDCKDFFYRLYAPMVRAGLATWDIPAKYKKRMLKFIKPHNHEWTKVTNPNGKLYVCKHIYALLQEFVGENIKARPLKGVKISKEVKSRIAADRAKAKADKEAPPEYGDKKTGDKHIGVDDALDQDKVSADMEKRKSKEAEKKDKETEEEEKKDKETEEEEKKDK